MVIDGIKVYTTFIGDTSVAANMDSSDGYFVKGWHSSDPTTSYISTKLVDSSGVEYSSSNPIDGTTVDDWHEMGGNAQHASGQVLKLAGLWTGGLEGSDGTPVYQTNLNLCK